MKYVPGQLKSMVFLTTSELAELLKMNAQVVTRKLQAGEIEAFKIGKDWRIPEAAVATWLETRSNQNLPKSEREKVIRTFVVDGRVTKLPSQRGRRKHVLEYMLSDFVPGRAYSEKEVNEIIGRHFDDFCTVRREMIIEKMMDRKGGIYRRRLLNNDRQ